MYYVTYCSFIVWSPRLELSYTLTVLKAYPVSSERNVSRWACLIVFGCCCWWHVTRVFENICFSLQVYEQCMKYVWKNQVSPVFIVDDMYDDSVNLTLYYESLCPDCRDFILKQLYPVMQQVGSIINLVLIPYGNAHVSKH